MSESPEQPRQGAPSWMRSVIIGGSMLTVLLLGASAGLLLGQSTRSATPAPSAVDTGFSQDMSAHHRQAVLMAGLARDRSRDPVIRTLAVDVETTQLEQIGRMQGWLSMWNAGALAPGHPMTWMTPRPAETAHGGAGGATSMEMMPGMASAQELNLLGAATGREFDVQFLQLLLRHHQGGTPMLREAANRAEIPQVRTLARQMLTAQASESEYLTRLIADRGARPLPPPA